jgi:hypothetical protein
MRSNGGICDEKERKKNLLRLSLYVRMPRIRFMERSFRAPEEKGKIRHKFYMILNTHHAVLLNNDQLSHSPRQTIP